MKYLVETALLTHGLRSVTNEEIRRVWTDEGENIAWVSAGKIVIGDMETYLAFRDQKEDLIRINCETLGQALLEGRSGALTASGTMAVCARYGIPLAVTCGMGGIGDIKGEELCPDLPALAEIPVGLISAGPKDMLDRKGTIDWLVKRGVSVLGTWRDYCTGYLFSGEKVRLQGIYEGSCEPPCLIINEIPEENRISRKEILEEAIQKGKQAEQSGYYYHPAVNGWIDRCTEGESSRIQLRALMENAKFAGRIDGFCV